MARLIILARNNSARQVNLGAPITTIGRSHSNNVCLDSDRVSRYHAVIQWTGQRYLITDMGSRNGTYVNQERVRAQELNNGDTILIGDCQLRFLCSSRASASVDALKLLPATDDFLQLAPAR
ncbi:MAG: FHA domain-containing protein [Variovorax sp.]|nr:FHA domain-containing protein [Variovorax sp.]